MGHDPTTLLRDEHEVIAKAQKLIPRIDQLWMRDAALYDEVVRTLLSFFVSYSDGFHHQKEERALFPALKKHPDFYQAGMLDELEEHHEMFREHVAAMNAALANKDYQATQRRLTIYVNELLDHIAVENDELFVLTESIFNDSELEKLYFQFKDIDQELGEPLKRDLESSLVKIAEMATRLRVG